MDESSKRSRIEVNGDEAEAVLMHLDENHDGRLTVNEFVDFVLSDTDTEGFESKVNKMEDRLRKFEKSER